MSNLKELKKALQDFKSELKKGAAPKIPPGSGGDSKDKKIDKGSSVFNMGHVETVSKMKDHQEAKGYAHKIVDESTANPENRRKIKAMIERSRNANDLARGMTNHILAHPSEGLKVIKSVEPESQELIKYNSNGQWSLEKARDKFDYEGAAKEWKEQGNTPSNPWPGYNSPGAGKNTTAEEAAEAWEALSNTRSKTGSFGERVKDKPTLDSIVDKYANTPQNEPEPSKSIKPDDQIGHNYNQFLHLKTEYVPDSKHGPAVKHVFKNMWHDPYDEHPPEEGDNIEVYHYLHFPHDPFRVAERGDNDTNDGLYNDLHDHMKNNNDYFTNIAQNVNHKYGKDYTTKM